MAVCEITKDLAQLIYHMHFINSLRYYLKIVLSLKNTMVNTFNRITLNRIIIQAGISISHELEWSVAISLSLV